MLARNFCLLRIVQALSLTLAAALLAVATPLHAAAEDGFKPLFDGQTLEGWDGNPEYWSVKDGAITGTNTAEKPTPGNTFIIWRGGTLDDFELKVKFKIVGNNSGIQYRSRENPDDWGRWVISGYQADFEAGDTYSGILYEERARGILALRGQKTTIGQDHRPHWIEQFADGAALQAAIKKADWNDYHIIARGNHFIHKINGQLMSEVHDDDAAARVRSGLLALQLHAGPPMEVQFKDIMLKRLPLEDMKKVVLIAGNASHGFGAHDHTAGCHLLAKALKDSNLGILPVVYEHGWPKDPTALDNADSVVLYSDGADGHMVIPHLAEVDARVKQGMGIACLHFAVEVPKGPAGDQFLSWLGGYFEVDWSVNPHWEATFSQLPEHAITRGVRPFTLNDEWYYHMRFRPEMQNVQPILSAVPPDGTRGPDGARSGNPTVRSRKGQPETVAWASEQPGSGRGFGITGGHVHWNWGHPDFRKLVLNAICWTANVDVPGDGVPSGPVSLADLLQNHDEPKPDNLDEASLGKMLEEWNQ